MSLFDDTTTAPCELCDTTTLDTELTDWALPRGVIVRACERCDVAARELQDTERMTMHQVGPWYYAPPDAGATATNGSLLPLRLRYPDIWAEKAQQRREDERCE